MYNNTHIFYLILSALCDKFSKFQTIYSADVTNGKIVTLAGWGWNMHHDNFGKGIDGASFSSCMTNELGEILYRFDYCDLRDLVA